MAEMTLDELRARLHPTGDDGEWFARDELALMVEGIDAALKQREQDAKDADRYRWLRLRLLVTEVESMSNVSRKHLAVQTAGDSEYIADLDETLDAAMAKESGNG